MKKNEIECNVMVFPKCEASFVKMKISVEDFSTALLQEE